MHNQDAEISLASAADSEPLLTLINLVQPHLPWTAAHLHWQFFAPPAGPAKLYVVRQDDQILSLYSAVPHAFSVGSGVIEARMIQDVMTHPNARGQGYLHRLAAHCMQEIERDNVVGYTFPNELSEGSFRRTGWTELLLVPSRKALITSHSHHPDITIQPNHGFREVETEIWNASGVAVGVRRDAPYLSWRYGKPNMDYRPFLVEHDRGMLILKLYREQGMSFVHILELTLRQSAIELLDQTLRFCFDFAATHGAKELTAWLPAGHQYAATFDAMGLTEQPRARFMFAYAPAELRSLVLDAAAWHLSQGDSDVY